MDIRRVAVQDAQPIEDALAVEDVQHAQDAQSFDDFQPVQDAQSVDDELTVDAHSIQDVQPAEDVAGSEDTWTDQTSGITWQVTPPGVTMVWSSANAYCTGLSLDGGGWHLPTIDELRTLIRGCPATEDGGSCNVGEADCLAMSCKDEACDGCGFCSVCYWPDEMQGPCDRYWSSSPVDDGGGPAWYAFFYSGRVGTDAVYYNNMVRCVR